MVLENRVFTIDRPPRFPGAERNLAQRVEKAVESISGEMPTERSQVLLGILTYCYTLGIYGSEEIEKAIANAPEADSVHAIAFQNSPPAAALRAFRRANRPAILQCLACVLEGPDPLTEAIERVRLAIEADSFALDF